MYVVMDRIKMGRLKRTTSIRVHPTARVGGSSMRLRPRQKVTVDQLLTGMAVASGNDAAMAISQHISGNSRNFTHLMNHKARQLGMTRTVFKNPTGLPAAGQRTTARDMATLARAYLRSHPQAMRYHSLRRRPENGLDRGLGLQHHRHGAPGQDPPSGGGHGRQEPCRPRHGRPQPHRGGVQVTGFAQAGAQAHAGSPLAPHILTLAPSRRMFFKSMA